jgi:hypothetical protein
MSKERPAPSMVLGPLCLNLRVANDHSKHCLGPVWSLFKGHGRTAPRIVVGPLTLCLRVTQPIQELSLDRLACFRVVDDQIYALSSDQLSFALDSEYTRSMHCLSPGQDLLDGHERSTPTFVIRKLGRCLG